MNAFRAATVAVAVCVASGCTHSMQVKNLNEYTLTSTAPRALTIELLNGNSGSGTSEYFNFVHQALATHPNVARVLTDHDDSVPVDAIVTVSPTAQYHGAGSNYFVTFPGFLFFTHAWNGFKYRADIATQLDVRMANNGRNITRGLHTEYDLRHCDMERGTASSSGWYLPGWGVTNVFVGFFMTRYDDDVTPEFLRMAGPAYGSYVANSIVEAVGQEVATVGSVEPLSSACVRFDAASGAFTASCAPRS